MPIERQLGRALAGMLAVTLVLAGCAKELQVRHYPSFYSPEIKTVAVLPFGTAGADSPAGSIFTDKFARALQTNGTYQVVRLPEFQRASTEQVLADLQARGDIHAVFTGSLTTFRTASYGYYSGWSRRRTRHYRDHWDDYPDGGDFYNEATVAARAAMIRVSDGETIHSTPSPLAATAESPNYPGGQAAAGLLDMASEMVIDDLLDQFAIVTR